MAEEQEDAVFWLPPEFLAEGSTEEEEEEEDNEGFVPTAGGCNGGYSFPSEFPFDWVSPLGSRSPGVDSFLTETESEEDGFSFAGCASAFPFHQSATEEVKDLPCSPQSTLWEGPVSELESPLSPLKSRQSDLVCQAATQLARIRVDGGGEQQKTQKHQQSTTSPSPSGTAASPTTRSTAAAWSSPVPVPALQKLQVHSKQRGVWGKHGKSTINEGAAGYGGGGGGPLGLPSSAWPPLKPPQKTEAPSQSATSTVVPGGPAAAPRESYGGTGVFLPRNNHLLNNRPVFRRKKTEDDDDDDPFLLAAPCTPVLLPARVVQALKLDLDENGSIRRMPHAIILDQDAIVAHNMTLLHRRGLFPRSAAATSAGNQETARLPQEWTY